MAARCFTTSSTWRDLGRDAHLTQELPAVRPMSGGSATSGVLFSRITSCRIRSTFSISRHCRISIRLGRPPAFTSHSRTHGTFVPGAQLYVESLADTRARLFANCGEVYKAGAVNRPRTIGVRFSYQFRGS